MTENPEPSGSDQPQPPQYGAPQYGTPQQGPPDHGTPPYGPPGYGSPQQGSAGPAYGQPAAYGPPAYPQPPVGQPPMGRPLVGQPLSAADERTWGMFAHLSALLAGLVGLSFLGPLVVWLMYRDRSAFVRRHAVESLNFQISLWIYAAIAGVASILTLGVALIVVIPLLIIGGIGAIILCIIAGVTANGGGEYRYPLTLRLVS